MCLNRAWTYVYYLRVRFCALIGNTWEGVWLEAKVVEVLAHWSTRYAAVNDITSIDVAAASSRLPTKTFLTAKVACDCFVPGCGRDIDVATVVDCDTRVVDC